MRPLYLEMQAFGPYAEVERIDFRKLADIPLFLITGPTGSGKSSIFEGISFALYGKSADDQRDSRLGTRGFRSHHSRPELETRVRFSFALADAVYMIDRQPAQELPKKREPEKFRSVPARAELYRRTGEEGESPGNVHELNNTGGWVLVADKETRVTEAVHSILGYDREQFRQVVMLPQGRFRELLIADSKSREQILSTLFDTGRYEAIERILVEEHREISDQLKSLDAEKERLQNEMAALGRKTPEGGKEAGGAEAPVAPPETAGGTGTEATEGGTAAGPESIRPETMIARLQKQLAQIETEIAAARKERESAGKTLQELRERDQAFGELDAAQAEAEAVEAESRTIAAVQKELAGAEAAQLLDEPHRNLERSRKAEKQRKQEAAEAEGKKGRAETALQAAENQYAEQKKQEEHFKGLDEELLRLKGLLDTAEALEKTEADLHAIREEHASAVKTETELKASIEQNRQELEQSEGELKEASDAAGRLEAARNERDYAGRLVREKTGLEELTDKLEAAQKEQASAEDQQKTAEEAVSSQEEEYRQLLRRQREGRAALLAEGLEEGTPCPVCGSVHHPEPASSPLSIPGDEAVEQASRLLESARKEADQKRKAANTQAETTAALKSRMEALRSSLGDEAAKTLDDLQERAERAEAYLAELEKQTAGIEDLEKQVETAQSTRKRLETELASSAASLRELELQLRELETRQKEQTKALPEGLTSTSALSERIRSLTEQSTTFRTELEQAEAAKREAASAAELASAEAERTAQAASEAETELAEAEKHFLRRLQEAGFETESDLLTASRSSQEISDLKEQIERFTSRAAAAKNRLERARAAVAEKERPDVDKAAAELEKQESDLEQLLGNHTRLEERLRRLEELSSACREVNKDYESKQAAYTRLGKLAETAAGKGANTLRLSFHDFVLSSLLDEILEAASRRLQIMSRKRYSLHRRREPGDRRRRSGLDLEVFDAYTGTSRDAGSLSGGESFLAALSLAMGMAEVVTARQGGIKLDTLFIDEGFGSLDAEALDAAIDALTELQNSGRLIGVISHVQELKNRIDTRLEVLSGQSGSSTRFVLP
ncbi:MAG: SMC family ATPase [Spirochaetales bacterium]|nr:SMC family ATPase [Spirochaetales bacterium]MCF7939065.1 SMC family ATPase [Spirochaetales bacterium]